MKNQRPELTQAQRDELAALDADDQIDTTDIPDIRDWLGAMSGKARERSMSC